MPLRLRPADPTVVGPALERFRSGRADTTDLRLVTKHLLALLVARAPGGAVEVRVPPYAVAQCVAGTRHVRGTPPAVVEMDAATWIALGVGDLSWDEAERSARLVASGERSDLSALLPLIGPGRRRLADVPQSEPEPPGQPTRQPRGDGLLSLHLDPSDPGPQDACGVFGVWAPGEDVAKLTYFGLYALQHRGQESAGMAVSNGHQILVYKDMGLVSQVFDEASLNSLTGHLAIGHCRYSTTGGSFWENAQPTIGGDEHGSVALAHNGNLVNSAELRELMTELRRGPRSGEPARSNTTDTALVTGLLVGDPDRSLEATALDVLPRIRGAFSFVFMDEEALYAARDPQGVRPLVLGRLERGWVVASESAALATVGASVVREIEPGELLVIDGDGPRSHRFAPADPKGCVFEYVYLARPDATIAGRGVYAARVEMGRLLAKEHPVDADLVIPVPESGTPAAIGYAEASGIPYGVGFVKNAYVGRTFIQPSQTLRQLGIRLKLNALEHVIRGRRLVVVDDSIVRGNTQRAQVRMLREAGAAEVHVRISSPPVRWPCFYGIDFASRAELIATGLGVEEIAASIGADSLGYISEDGMLDATDQPTGRLCTACFTGQYPIELPDEALLGKHSLEVALPGMENLPFAPRRDAHGVGLGQSGR